MSKRTLRNRFFSKRLNIKQNSAKIEACRFQDVLLFQVQLNFFQSEKSSVQVSSVPKLTVFLSDKASVKYHGDIACVATFP